MFKISGDVATISLDLRSFKPKFKKDMIKVLKQVAAIWLNAASGRVPVWSGMALASLSNVAEFAGTGLVITPKSGVKSKIALGKVMGSVAVVTTSKLYSITMRTTVPHYVMQEETYVGASPSAPWQSFPAGIAAVANLKIDIDPPVFKSKRFKFQ